MRVGWLMLAITLSASLMSCATPSPVGTGRGLQTPSMFSETTLLHSERVGDDLGVRRVTPGYQVPADWQDHNDYVKQGDAFTISVHSVYIPKALGSVFDSPDVVTLLDLELAPGQLMQDLAVSYQEDVRAGSRLNFRDLTVFSTLSYDPNLAPYFRLRLIDLDKPEAASTANILNESRKLSSSLGSFYPSPHVPAFDLAFTLGQMLVEMDEDDPILDFECQLYPLTRDSQDDISNKLKYGAWIAVGLPNDDAERARVLDRNALPYWDAFEGRLRYPQDDAIADLPLIVFEVQRGSRLGPAIIQQRTSAFQDYMTENWNYEPTTLDSYLSELTSAMTAFSMLQGLMSPEPRKSDLDRLFAKLTDLSRGNLVSKDLTLVTDKIRKVLPSEVAGMSLDELAMWWEEHKDELELGKNGTFQIIGPEDLEGGNDAGADE